MRAKLLLAITLALVLGAIERSVYAGSCTSNVTTNPGNWNAASTWGAGCTGAGGIPAAIDNVTIASGDTVQVTASASVASVTMAGGAANNALLNINSGFALNVTGNVTYAASTSNTRTRRITLGSNAQLLIGGNLAMNSGAVTGSVTDLAIASGASTLVQVGGSITFSGTVAPTVTFGGAGTLTVAGDFGNGGAMTAASGTVIYNGAGAQNLGTYTYNNLTISKSGGTATATANVTTASLTFAAANAGLINMSSGTLSVTGTCPTAVARTGNGYVIGNLKLTFAAGAQTCTYDVGDASNYTPITVALTGATAGTITGSVTNAAPPNLSTSPLSSSKYVNRYWTLGAAGNTATATSYDATLNWVAGDIQGGANYQNFIVGENQGGWVVPSPAFASNAPTSIVATSVTTAFSSGASFGVGEAYACVPPANAPAGVVCVCDNFGRPNLNPSTIFNSNWLLSTSSGSFGIPKIVNQGRLELTDNTGNNATAATVPGIFPAAGNYISVEFKQYAYSGSGADGIAVTLSDYSIAPTPGAFGGSLGYAQKTGINGFAGGWIGVALDEYGNYENNTEGRQGGTPPCAGTCPNSVGIRGSGSGTTGYPWLAGNTSAAVAVAVPGSAAPAPGNLYQIIIDARNYTSGTHTALVSVNRDTTTQTGANYTAVVTPFDAYIVNPAQAAVPVNWQISFTGSTGGSTDIHEIGNLRICSQTIIAPTGSSTAAGFNAIDSALPNTKQNALFGHIYMKLANVPFKLNVAALAPPVGGVSQGVNTAYASSGNKTVTVNLIDDSQAGGSCNASASACSSCAKPVVATQVMTFTAANAGFATSANFTVAGAYKRLIARMSDGSTTGCSVDAFSVRPAYYALSSSVSAPTKSGTSFTVTATPKDINNNTVAGTTGAPTLDNTKAPAAGGNQTLLLQSWNAGASFGTFIYNDVGSFTLPPNAIYDTQFGNNTGEAQDRTNGDCNPGTGTSPYTPLFCYGYSGASCTNATPFGPDSGGKYSCDIGSAGSPSIGRFYPDHYEASTAVTPGCSANSFTYMGQPFTMKSASSGAIQIKALANGQTFATAPGLPSFSTGYTPISSLWFGAQNGTGSTTDLIKCISSTQNTSPNRCNATTLPFTGSASTTWAAGVYTAPATTFYFDPPKDTTTTPDATWGPYSALNVGVTVSDSDGSTLTIPSGQSFVLNGTTYQAINGSSTLNMLYGRLFIANASGSEQIPLVVPVWIQYWNGSGWAPNALDTSCTSLAPAPPAAFGGNTAAAACFGSSCTGTAAGGVGSVFVSRIKNVQANTTTPSYSSSQFSFGQRNMVLAAPKATGTIGLSVQAPTWLTLGPNDPTGANPSATLNFGSFNSRFIFLRENY